MTGEKSVNEIWNQKSIPVVYREATGRPLRVRLPFREDNRSWLREGHQRQPEWNKERKYWVVPSTWFDDVIERSVRRFGGLYVIQAFKTLKKCAPACWRAQGFDCDCSCMGANHGSESGAGWRVISDTFAVRSGERRFACRLIKASHQ